MKGLEGLTGLLDAPRLTELQLSKAVGLAPDDADRVAAHPSVQYLDWFAEDVPHRIWMPFTERVGLPRADGLHPWEWFARQK